MVAMATPLVAKTAGDSVAPPARALTCSSMREERRNQ